MSLRPYPLFVLLATTPVCAPAFPFLQDPPAVVRTLSVTGIREVSEQDVRAWLTVRAGVPLTDGLLDRDLATVRDRYRALGFLSTACSFDVVPDPGDSTRADVRLTIDEGRRTVVGSIRLAGVARLDPEEVVSRFETSVGDPLDVEILERDLDDMLRAYEEAGFPFARCSIGAMDLAAGEATDSLLVTIDVDEGEAVTIGEITVEGTKETDTEVVAREARIAMGEAYSPDLSRTVQRRLQRLNIFTEVAEPELYTRNGTGGLLLKVTEGNANTFDGVIGYLPATLPGESGVVTGLVIVGLRNLFGTGRRLHVRWQREATSTQELALRYQEPWLFGAPVHLSVGFFQRQQDSAYVQRSLDGGIEVLVADDISIGATLAGASVIPSSTVSVARVSRSSMTSAGLFFRLDTRSEPISPVSGLRLVTEYQYGRKNLGDSPASSSMPGVSTVQRFLTDAEFYASPFLRQVVALGVHGRQVKGPAVEESEMIRFGGATSLRGYRENQFLGTLVAWSNAEYRLLTGRRSFVYGFFDTGYYTRPSLDSLPASGAEALLFGYGVGVRLDTAIGNLAVSVALGKGESLGEAKIHLGLVNDF